MKAETKREKKKKIIIPEKFEEKFGKKKINLLDKYIKFYQSWDSHRNSLNFAYKLKDRVKQFKNDLIKKKSLFEVDLNYLDESLNMIIECNKLLKNIFVYEYFLDESTNDAKIVLFENNVEILQNQTDLLLELLELDQLPNIMKIDDQKKFQEEYLKYKDHALALIKSTKTFKKNLIDEIENNINAKFNYEAIKELDAYLNNQTKRKKKK